MTTDRNAEAKKHEEREGLEERLGALLERVRDDAHRAPEAFLDQTEVPEGGE